LTKYIDMTKKKQTAVSIIYQMISEGRASELPQKKDFFLEMEKKQVTEGYMANFNPAIPYQADEEEDYFNKNYIQ